MREDVQQLVIRAEHSPASRRMAHGAKGKIAFEMSDTAHGRQIPLKQTGRRFIEQLMSGAHKKISFTGFVKNLLRILDTLCKRLFNVYVASRLQGCKGQ